MCKQRDARKWGWIEDVQRAANRREADSKSIIKYDMTDPRGVVIRI